MLFFEFDLVFEEADSLAVANTSFDEFKTFFKLFVVLLIVFTDESSELFGSVVNLTFNDKVMVSFESRGFDEDDINKISLFKSFENLIVGLFQHIYASSFILIKTQFCDGFSGFSCFIEKFEHLETIVLSKHLRDEFLA